MQPDVQQELFSQAVRDADTDQMLWLLRSGTLDVNFRDVTHDLETPLMRLCHSQYFTQSGGSHSAVSRNDVLAEILGTLEGVKVKIDQQDALGRTLAMHACISNNEVMLMFAMNRKCDPTVADRKGKNLVHYVAMSGNDHLVDLVLENLDVGQALRTLDYQGYSPVDLARQKKHSALARKLSTVLVGTNKEGKVTTAHTDHERKGIREAHEVSTQATSAENARASREQNISEYSSVVPSPPYRVRRNVRMPVYNNPEDSDEAVQRSTASEQPCRASTPPLTSATNEAKDLHEFSQNDLVRSVSLRRSYIVRRSNQNGAVDSTMTPRTARSVRPLYSPPPVSQNDASTNLHKQFPNTYSHKHGDPVIESLSHSDPDIQQEKVHPRMYQTLPNKNWRQQQGRLISDQPFREQQATSERKHTPSLESSPFQSTRPRLKQLHDNRHLHLPVHQDNECDKSRSHRQNANTGDTYSDAISISPQKHLRESDMLAHNSSLEIQQGEVNGMGGRKERRSSISLPDLRDMTGCLVTSRDTQQLRDLTQGRKSRITLEDLDRRDNIRSYKHWMTERDSNNRGTSSLSDVSMDSNFEDERPIKKH